ncbi:MAG TPA: hypothetical protein VKE40_06825 [Gemmataceae bacterium]|nr:hypothetical protein [Gemmataceae bacterium]
MPSESRPLHIRNQRYPRWVVVAENVLVSGMLVAFLVIESLGLWLFDMRTAMYILLAAFLAVLPIAVYGWLLIWDLSRPGPGRGVTARALYERVFLGIRHPELGAAVEWTVLTALRSLLPSVHTVSELKLGAEIAILTFRFPPGVVKRVRFSRDPGEDFQEFEPPLQLCEATVEILSGRQFQLTVDEADAQRLREWAVAKGIAVCDCDGYRPRSDEALVKPDDPAGLSRGGTPT